MTDRHLMLKPMWKQEYENETRIRKRKGADSCGEDQHGDTSELNTDQ